MSFSLYWRSWVSLGYPGQVAGTLRVSDAGGGKSYLTRTIHGSKRHAEEIPAQMIVEAGGGSRDVTDGTVRDLATRWIAVAQWIETAS